MKCEIIKDLIPLVCDGLCSEESEREIARHIENCEDCRLLYENSSEKTEDIIIPSEKETFKKVNRKFKNLTLKSGIIAVLLIMVLAVLGWLTYGQITKGGTLKSFETIFQSFEVRKIADYIAEGDFDSYVDSISEECYTGVYFTTVDELKEKDKQLLSETFEKAYGDTEVKSVHVNSAYENVFFYSQDAYAVKNDVTIEFENGKFLDLIFIKNADGKYYLPSGSIFLDYKNMDNEIIFRNVLAYVSMHDLNKYNATIEQLIRKTNDSTGNASSSIYSKRFQGKYHEQVIAGRKSFHESGFTITDVYFSQPRFDNEKDMLYYDFTIEAEDSEGTALMKARMYYDYMGLYPPEKDDIKIYSDNCTPELEKTLYNFFG